MVQLSYDFVWWNLSLNVIFFKTFDEKSLCMRQNLNCFRQKFGADFGKSFQFWQKEILSDFDGSPNFDFFLESKEI